MRLRLMNVLAVLALAAAVVCAILGLLLWVIVSVGVAVTLAIFETS